MIDVIQLPMEPDTHLRDMEQRLIKFDSFSDSVWLLLSQMQLESVIETDTTEKMRIWASSLERSFINGSRIVDRL